MEMKTDLKQKQSIDDAVKQIPNDIHAIFCCAGIANPPFSKLDVALVNFVGHRHLTESLLQAGIPFEFPRELCVL